MKKRRCRREAIILESHGRKATGGRNLADDGRRDGKQEPPYGKHPWKVCLEIHSVKRQWWRQWIPLSTTMAMGTGYGDGPVTGEVKAWVGGISFKALRWPCETWIQNAGRVNHKTRRYGPILGCRERFHKRSYGLKTSEAAHNGPAIARLPGRSMTIWLQHWWVPNWCYCIYMQAGAAHPSFRKFYRTNIPTKVPAYPPLH